MDLATVHRLVERIGSVDAACRDRGALEAAVRDLRRLRSWVEAREVLLARALAEVSSFPERSLADAGRTTLRQAEQVIRRAETTDSMPQFGSALGTGRVTGDHVDALGRVMRQLEPEQRSRLVERADSLVLAAEHSTADEFARALRRQVHRLDDETRAEARLQRQKRAVRLNSWIDRDTGMGRWSASWDPETMVRLENLVDAQVQAMFHDVVPEGCPTDLLERHAFLRAHAALAIIDGRGIRLGRPEIVVVVDHTQPNPDGSPYIDWDLPVEMPRRALDDLARRADIHTVVVRNGVVVEAPGKLNLGRSSRLANRDQRRALHAVYPCCAIPGCRVRFGRAKMHHVIFFERDHGMSDLENLLPVCEHHHQQIHQDNWLLTLTPERALTIRFPDGTVMTTGPPRRGAA